MAERWPELQVQKKTRRTVTRAGVFDLLDTLIKVDVPRPRHSCPHRRPRGRYALSPPYSAAPRAKKGPFFETRY